MVLLRRVQNYLAVLAWLCGTKIEDALSAPSVSGFGPVVLWRGWMRAKPRRIFFVGVVCSNCVLRGGSLTGTNKAEFVNKGEDSPAIQLVRSD